MKYDVILSIIFYLCGCFYMVFGAAIIATNTKNNINKLFLSLTSSLAIWSFSYSISTSAPSAEASAFWRSFSAFGWGIFSSFLLHFILVLTKKDRRFNKRRMLVVIYSPALINIILFGPFGFLVEKQYQMVQTDFGWTNMAPMYAGNIWLNVYYVMFSIASIMLLIGWWRTIEAHTPAKREAKHFILSIMFLFLIEAVIEFLPDLLGRKQHPKFAVPFLLIPTITLFSILRKTGLIEKRNKTYLSLEISKDLAGDRSRLFKMAAAIFLLGGAISFLIGYFGMNRTLEYELALAASMILMGIIMGFIPLITRKNTIQNIAILIICMLSMLYFMIKDVETGALTVWSIYILFLLFTVAIDDFGKGYSSLYRLKRVPFDKIKIDKGIIHHLDMEREKASITEIIILLARAFSATITAEGVETKEQADFLKSVACDEIQGYYFSKPLSEEALEEFLKKGILDVT